MYQFLQIHIDASRHLRDNVAGSSIWDLFIQISLIHFKEFIVFKLVTLEFIDTLGFDNFRFIDLFSEVNLWKIFFSNSIKQWTGQSVASISGFDKIQVIKVSLHLLVHKRHSFDLLFESHAAAKCRWEFDQVQAMDKHWFIVAVFLVQDFGKFCSNFVCIVEFGEEVDEEVPEKEASTNESEQEIDFVGSFDELFDLSIRSELKNVGWIDIGISFSLYVSVTKISESHGFDEGFGWVSEERFISVVKELNSGDKESLSS